MKIKPFKKTKADLLIRSAMAAKTPKLKEGQEYLTGCGLIRGGVTHGLGQTFHSHSDLRRSLGDVSVYQENLSDTPGFVTNRNRFLPRKEASYIAAMAGQISASYEGRSILSSDIRWIGLNKQ